MRARLASIAIATALLAGPAAIAAPTCWNGQGETVRCGTPGALPVGADLTPQQEAMRAARPASPPAGALIGLAIVLAGLFGLIAVLPDFERFDH